MNQRADVAVIGAGIVGLAHAWAAARRGLKVVLFERDPLAQGASIRNFGMVWPVGQPAGTAHQTALASRARWLELRDVAGIWVNECGSIHLAYREDELAVLTEFAERASALGYDCQMLTPAQVGQRSPAAQADGLLGGLWSPMELCVNPRETIRRLPNWLREACGVELQFGTTICRVELPEVEATDGRVWRVEHAVVAGGVEFQTLFPAIFAAAGLRKCKLQMLRTGPQPDSWRIGPHLAGGLTLRHYANFQVCPSLAALKQRIAAETPELDRYGIHVMASQNDRGEVILGDSHEYGDDITPFDKEEIDRLILAHVERMVRLRDPRIVERWHGLYAKHPDGPQFMAEPQPGVRIVAATGGAGMTMSFGLAHAVWDAWD